LAFGVIEVTNIIAGLILAMGILPLIPAVGKSLEKVAKWLGRFQTIIGVIAIILGIVFFSLIQGTVAIICGLILAMGILASIPALGKYLVKLSKALGSFQTIIGIIAIIVGILGIVGMI
jgi:membrane protein HdeD